MTIYGESGEQFRTGPGAGTLLVTTTALLLVCAELVSLLLAGINLWVAVTAGLESPLILHAPFADDFRLALYSTPPLGPRVELVPLISWVLCAGLAVVLVYFWPTEQHFSTRLFVHIFALSLLLWGVLAPSFQPDNFRIPSEMTGMPRIAWSALAVAIGAWLSMLAQRKLVNLLTNVHSMWTPSQRLVRWIQMLPLGLLILGIVALVNNYLPGALAALTVLIATLLETLARRPGHHYERVRQPDMREAVWTLPIATAILLGATFFVWGSAGLGETARRTMVFGSRGVTFPKVLGLTGTHPIVVEKGRGGATGEPKMMLRWSRDRGKKGKTLTAPEPPQNPTDTRKAP